MSKIINPKIITSKLLDYLDSKEGLKPKVVSNITGLNYNKLRNIKNQGKGGTIEIVNTLLQHFPILATEFDLHKEEDSAALERIAKLEKENLELKEEIRKILHNQNKIWEKLGEDEH